jgi:hypothetical protein
MNSTARHVVSGIAIASAALLAWSAGCGGTSKGSGFGSSNGGSSSGTGGSSSGTGGGSSGFGGFGDGSVGSSSSSGGAVQCPSGMQCDVQCSGGGTNTTITGKVYDPAGRNPLYNVAVYVPAAPLQPLPTGVPTGADACSCAALFKSGAVVAATTIEDGTFTIKDAPVGKQIPLVIQVGKWRRQFKIDTTACTNNAVPDKTLLMPNSVVPGNPTDSMPQIAVSTGSSDSLECLLTRVGLPPTEYTPGPGGSGHIHIFSGGDASGASGAGTPEANPMTPVAAPDSPSALWANQGQLMPFDIVMLSCEGGETFNPNPAALEQYLNVGGRVFASHYHYAWFSGPMETPQSFTVPADWGSHLATWTPGSNGGNDPLGGAIVQTLNGSTKTFPKGQSLFKWLGIVKALGQGVKPTELPIYQSRYNASVGPSNTASQTWINADDTTPSPTEYFSFDTPANAQPQADGGAPNYCGRVVFSDLHVAGNTTVTPDNSPPPGGCVNGPLSEQEAALEFMLFDLSSCVIPDTVAPPQGVPAQ